MYVKCGCGVMFVMHVYVHSHRHNGRSQSTMAWNASWALLEKVSNVGRELAAGTQALNTLILLGNCGAS